MDIQDIKNYIRQKYIIDPQTVKPTSGVPNFPIGLSRYLVDGTRPHKSGQKSHRQETPPTVRQSFIYKP